jgi:hypothetical protein
MPLIIKELIAHVETPQGEPQPINTPTGDQEESNQQLLEQLEISREREQRLHYD